MGAACELCGGDRFEELLVAYDRVVARRDDFTYRRCRLCSLVVLVDPPGTLADRYPPDYSPHQASHRQDPAPQSARRRPSRRLISPRGGRRMLDVGCGSGRLLARHRDLGWKARGLEPNEHAAQQCREQGLDVETASLSEVSLPDAEFDAIWLHHVIEHVPSPLDDLRRIRRALAPGGIVIVVTPNVAGLGFRLYGSCWYAIDAPRHLRLFDARTLAALARRAGFETPTLSTEASARVLASSRHYQRSQGPVLPPGLAARAAVLDRSLTPDADARRFRRWVRPLSRAASWFGRGENLRAELTIPVDAS
jgi:SAM-dependent methyltransferase